MLIRSTDKLHYPITVTKLLVKPGAKVKLSDVLFKYTFTSKVSEGNKYGDEVEVERTFPAEFKSETDGEVVSWQIKTGAVLEKAGISLINIEEPCTHEETFGNLCVNCGQDITKLDNSLTSVPNASRATVNTSHTNTALKISQRMATKSNEEATRRLLESRKLILVVDLDQTIIHATVDPTVAEWQKDPENPNHSAVKDVRAFQLVDDGPGMRGTWYYIKLRPGLEEFLEKIAQKYELHIYTMGTRAYAQNIAKIVDPARKFFGDRILSRDESGSQNHKSLERLFPVDTDMVAIIDDRGDVWSWSANLVKVTPYDFFVGIGDINGSFLPKTQESVVAKSNTKAAIVTNGAKAADVEATETPEVKKIDGEAGTPAVKEEVVPAALEAQLVAMAGGDDEDMIEEKIDAQEEAIASQLEDRPLLKKQEALDKLDGEETTNGEVSDTASDHSQKHRHNLLHDDDEELRYLQMNLEHVHQSFFEEFDKRKIGAAGGRVAALRGDKSSPKKTSLVDELTLKPDIKDIMPEMKSQVLKDVVLCFTGVIPQGIPHEDSDLGMWAQSFGARVNTNLTKSTTHVIGHKERRTTKLRQAFQHPNITIVTVSWLLECFTRWVHADERPYVIESEHVGGHHDSLPFDELAAGITLTPSEDGDRLDDLPDDLHSPTSFEGGVDWGEMDDDFKDFMGSDADSDLDEEGTESDASDSSVKSGTSSLRRRKRKRATSSVDGGEENGEGVGSDLQMRKKRALERSTGLANVLVANEIASDALPSPESRGPEEEEDKETNGAEVNGDDEESDGDFDDEFEKEMMEAMNSASDDEEAEAT